jgi:hypothetical protein
VEAAVKKLLLLAGAALAMSACADSSTAPTRKVAPADQAKHDDFTCKSGYVIAYDEFGNPYCVPDGGSGTNGANGSSPP